MKKALLTLVIIVAISTVSTPVAMVEEAHAMGSLGCSTAADLNWESWNWNDHSRPTHQPMSLLC